MCSVVLRILDVVPIYLPFKFRSAADHTGHLVLVPEEHLCYSGNVFDVFNCVILREYLIFF